MNTHTMVYYGSIPHTVLLLELTRPVVLTFSSFMDPVTSDTDQQDCQSKCCQCVFLQPMDMLKFYISVGSIFNCILWQQCAYGLVWFRHKNHFDRVGKRSYVGSKYLVLLPKTQLELSCCHVKFIQWFHTHKCWNVVHEQWSLACNHLTLFGKISH